MKQEYEVRGMTCAACQSAVERAVQKLPDVDAVQVNLLTGSMLVQAGSNQTAAVMEAVEKAGYEISLKEDRAKPSIASRSEEKAGPGAHFAREAKELRTRFLFSLALMVPLMAIAMGPMMGISIPFFSGHGNEANHALIQLLLTLPVVFLNRTYFSRGLKALWRRNPNMDSLIAIGSGAALLYGIYVLFRLNAAVSHGDLEVVHHLSMQLYFESAAMILTLITLGKYLEARAKTRTTDALAKLMDLTPKEARVLRDGKEILVATEDIRRGDLLVIRPGERLPVDGTVAEGRSNLDTSAITGESIPVPVEPGAKVSSGSVNLTGSFTFEATRVGDDTTLAQIIRLVEEANATKAPIAKLADQIAGVFVPIVIGIATLTAVVWMAAGAGSEFAATAAISVLVISCPCALGLATPVAIMVGTGKGAGLGILIKSAEALETLHSIDTVLLDKTGTITSGTPAVSDVVPFGDEKRLWQTAADLEAVSEHPLSRAILTKTEELGFQPAPISDFEAVTGRGVKARRNGQWYFAGNRSFMTENGIPVEAIEERVASLAKEGKTPMLFASEKEVFGIIAVRDPIKESSAKAVAELMNRGITPVMLTGDNERTAAAIAKETGIKRAIGQVLPQEKEAYVRREQEGGGRVGMVGDGINDAPALARADVGVAIGAGTDIAIESADIVLVKSDLLDLVTAVDLSRATIRNIRQNLFWAFFYNVVLIPVAAGALFPRFGILLNPMLASAAMSLSSVFVVANSLRLNAFRSKVSGFLAKSDVPEPTKSDIVSLQEERIGENNMKKVMLIEGMTCGHCKARVETALNALDGVQAEASIEGKLAMVEGTDTADDVLKQAVEEAGYTVLSVEAVDEE